MTIVYGPQVVAIKGDSLAPMKIANIRLISDSNDYEPVLQIQNGNDQDGNPIWVHVKSIES